MSGTFFRAIPPDSDSTVFEPGYSFQGGNRYNPAGRLSALYFADDEYRAALEANLSYGACAIYEVEAANLPGVVTLDENALAALGLSLGQVTRPRLDTEGYRLCQTLGFAAFQAQGTGLLFPSALPGAPARARNLALFPAALIPRSGLRVVSRAR